MTTFHVSYAWTKSFIKSQLNWNYQASTITTSKLLKDYEMQGKVMAQICFYLVMKHNIPQELVVNIDPIGIHIVLEGDVETW